MCKPVTQSVSLAGPAPALGEVGRLAGLNRPLRKEDLGTLTAEDIRGSSLFADAEAEGDESDEA